MLAAYIYDRTTGHAHSGSVHANIKQHNSAKSNVGIQLFTIDSKVSGIIYTILGEHSRPLW